MKSFILHSSFILILLCTISCSETEDSKNSSNRSPNIANNDVQNFSVPTESKSWNLEFFETEDVDLIFDSYLEEKTYYKDELFYQNLLTMWHVNFIHIHEDLKFSQVKLILDDMDKMKFNIASLDTYYTLVNFNYKIENTNRGERLNAFYNKNHRYLTNAAWSNSELQKLKLKKLEQLNFINK